MKKPTFLSLIIPFLFLFSGCFSSQDKFIYNFDYPPPYINARLDEVFPASIKKNPRIEVKMDFPAEIIGYEMTYGDKIKMTVIKFQTPEEVQNYFQEHYIPLFKAKRGYTSLDSNPGSPNRVLAGRSKGPMEIAWTNQNWLFHLEGEDEESFDVVVRACRFLSREKKQ